MIEKRTADSAVAAVLMAVGLAQLWGGYTMDRLEIRHIHPASIPGLLPMFLGAVMFVLAVIVFVVSRRTSSDTDDTSENIQFAEVRGFAKYVLLAAVYALFLVGKVHFWLASSLFVFAFILLAEFSNQGSNSRKIRLALVAALIAVVLTGGISYMFERGFLVRLP